MSGATKYRGWASCDALRRPAACGRPRGRGGLAVNGRGLLICAATCEKSKNSKAAGGQKPARDARGARRDCARAIEAARLHVPLPRHNARNYRAFARCTASARSRCARATMMLCGAGCAPRGLRTSCRGCSMRDASEGGATTMRAAAVSMRLVNSACRCPSRFCPRVTTVSRFAIFAYASTPATRTQGRHHRATTVVVRCKGYTDASYTSC